MVFGVLGGLKYANMGLAGTGEIIPGGSQFNFQSVTLAEGRCLGDRRSTVASVIHGDHLQLTFRDWYSDQCLAG